MSDVPVEHPAATWAWRIGRVVLELAALVVAAMYALILGFISGMKCDEGCAYNSGDGNPTGVPWRDAADSWQWSFLPLIGVATLALVAATIALARIKGAGSIATWLVAALALLVPVLPWIFSAPA